MIPACFCPECRAVVPVHDWKGHRKRCAGKLRVVGDAGHQDRSDVRSVQGQAGVEGRGRDELVLEVLVPDEGV